MVKDYRAVEVINDGSCDCFLSQYAGKRLLLQEYINIVEVNQSYNCRCKIKRYADRRSNKDRRTLDIMAMVGNLYRRTRPFGRRQTDEEKRRQFEAELKDFEFAV